MGRLLRWPVPIRSSSPPVRTISGELLVGAANDAGVQIKVGEGQYRRLPWTSFSQEDLKKLAKIQKLEPLVEPFIEVTQEEKLKKTEVNLKQPERLERPAPQSLFGALFSSGLGLVVMLLLYAANIYAGYEVSIFRARPPALVCGVSAVLPFAGPIIFLSMPTKVAPAAETWEPARRCRRRSPPRPTRSIRCRRRARTIQRPCGWLERGPQMR